MIRKAIPSLKPLLIFIFCYLSISTFGQEVPVKPNHVHKTRAQHSDNKIKKGDLHSRIGIFVGLSSSGHFENELTPLAGLEFEFFDPILAPRHAASLQLRQLLKTDDFDATQLSVNYRFRIFPFQRWNIYLDTELAVFCYSHNEIPVKNDTGKVVAIKEHSGFRFDTPFQFGLGSEVQIRRRVHVIFSYNSIFSLIRKKGQNFPLNVALGLKYNL